MNHSVDTREIQHFSKDSSKWWDESGPFKPLHRMNPARLGYIRTQICAHFGRGDHDLRPFTGLSILDIGCGGGLVCEPMTRLGANMTGVDADENAIATARAHAAQSGLEITYKHGSAEDLDNTYDMVLALEIIEHVKNPQSFVESVAKLVKPGGLVIFSTLNRTPKSFALGIVAAEHLLRWVPKGTHTWQKFVKPSELARACRDADLAPRNVTGLVFNPLKNEFALSEKDMDVSYLLTAAKG